MTLIMKRIIAEEHGAAELVVYGLLVLFGLVVSGTAYVVIKGPMDTGIASVATTITSTFTRIAGL
ncbi:hypothetical protein AV654_19555 [Paenibacillus elgii]|uniref:Uncharacterized protein n=1 Tax=Paenibacillus elgii TaxID=189691 RepID=A0A161S1Q8_9BACL|nr:hypothetical protein [Paenibacillus elgii]KZE78174.1 hypothetical protein AV654_19555 [Paenibacillus elgii]